MLSLSELQEAFARSLRDPAAPVPAALRGAAGDGVKRRFDVYRNNVTVGLVEALEAAFPVVLALVGRDFFRAAARVYIHRHPPETPVLLLYGQHFGAMLDGFAPAASVPYLGDVARLEWARLAAHHAADAVPLPIEALAAVPAERVPHVTLRLHPSLSVLRSRWPAFSIWTATGDPAAAEVDMTQSEDALVLRPEMETHTRLLPPGGGPFLEELSRGRRLESAADCAAKAAAAFDLARHLRCLFDAGAVIAIDEPPGTEE
jgi:hypothetical protein